MRKSPYLAYVLLAALWLAVAVWQTAEHRRLRRTVEEAQLNRATDIANSLAVVIRSQRRFGTVSRSRLVEALEALARSRELLGIALLNPAGERVAAGGQAMPDDLADLAPGDSRHQDGRLLVAALVELGPEPSPAPQPGGWTALEEELARTAVVWSPEEMMMMMPPAPGGTPQASPPDEAEGPKGNGPPPGGTPPPDDGRPAENPWGRPPPPPAWWPWHHGHPFMRDPEKYRELYEKRGLHMMVLMLNDEPTRAAVRSDCFLRLGLVALALGAVAGFGLTWRALLRSADLHVRLAQVRAQNAHLHELNLAAAGLAHEVRNPLNLVRGIAQLVAGAEAIPAPARAQLGAAVQEVDRVTTRLNEFIDYAKPREPHLAAVSPVAVARDVARTLGTDFEDKAVTFECPHADLEVMADATMLRQVLFNLLLNASQAVPRQGRIRVQVAAAGAAARIDVIDNGPGVPEDARAAIFRPYFSLTPGGTGLGLAVVRQVALAHGWDIAYVPKPEGGSIFRLSGLQPAAKRTTT